MMNKKTLTICLISIFGMGYFMFHVNGDSATFLGDGASGIDKSSIIEARKLNEALYHKPVQKSAEGLLNPASLEGTDISYEFNLDDNRNLLPGSGLRDMFEYFLSSLGENDLEQVIGAIQSEIQSNLDEPARSQALDLLKRYIDYKIGIEELQHAFAMQEASVGMIEQLIARQAQVKAYRETYFDQGEYDAFFASEELQDSFLIEQLRVNADDSLSAIEKEQYLAAASLSLPEDIRATRVRAQQHAILGEKVRELRAQNASDGDIYRLREASLGSDAAEALSKLDERRSQWKDRLAAFSSEIENVRASSLSEIDRDESISQLLAYHFSDVEQKRVSALMNDGRL
jgi:lipase chaperone LimK